MELLTETQLLLGRISVDVDVMDGRPVIRGTRIPITEILNLLRQGDSFERINETYPGLTRLDVQAALAYAEAHLRAAEPDGDDDPDDDFRERIVLNPLILVGKPTIKGTRIPVSMILGLIGNGFTPDEIVADYPSLTPEDVRAAILYAGEYFDRLTAVPLHAHA